MAHDNEIRLAVFDCDGTLVDSQHSIIAAMRVSFAAHGVPEPAAADVRRLVGLPLLEAIRRLLPDAPKASHELLTGAYKQAFFDLRLAGEVSEPLYPGAVKALDALEDAGWMLAIATGKARRGLVATLGAHGILNRFISQQTGDLARGKPHPDMLLNAMSDTGAAAAQTVMIGDTSFDMEMAANAKILGVGVSWGYHGRDALDDAGAGAIVDDFGELPAALEQLISRNRCGD